MDDYGLLLFSKELSDFTIAASNGEEFPAHTTVLYKRSSFFRSMLSYDMKEKREKKVSLVEDREMVEQMLRYIYTNKYDRDLSKYGFLSLDARMYIMGDKYGIEGLRHHAARRFTTSSKPLAHKFRKGSLVEDFFSAVSMIYANIHAPNDEMTKIIVEVGVDRSGVIRRAMRWSASSEGGKEEFGRDDIEDGQWDSAMSDVPRYAIDVLKGVNRRTGELERGLLDLSRAKCTNEACKYNGTSTRLVWKTDSSTASCDACGLELSISAKTVKQLYSKSQRGHAWWWY